ncbi:MAG TPA: DNA repair protein RecN [Steroidobacteraceae bacterium]|jgi:DNA repair protein RecN (Recombination protein N)|nr:DNA repair protein RecN [Steroidobacteraceae bacterium]
MLRYLQIRDFAIIELVELELGGGLTVLTGETGAGKSIIVDALEMLAGARASAEVVRPGAERADIAATVDAASGGPALQRLLEEQAIECSEGLVMRRVVGSDGRSRAWLNGQSVPLQLLGKVAELLIDIHGQHEFQSLVRPAEQRAVLDAYGQLQVLARQVATAHGEWLTLLNRSVQLESAADERTSRLDLLRYQVQEIEALALSGGEFAALQEERARVANRSRLVGAVREALGCLYESEEPTTQALLARALTTLRAAATTDTKLTPQLTLLEEAQIRVQDASHALQQYLDALEIDPERAEQIERRLAAIEELARKHRIAPEELMARGASMTEELLQLEHAVADLGGVRAQLSGALAAYLELARQLSARRATAARTLAKQISARMQELGMVGGRFLIDVQPAEGAEPAPHGLDRVEFRVSTNPGQPPRALAKVASGGELSRLSLAVQVTCAGESRRSMVFDEVDAGIGGAVAEIVGRELRALATRAQVLCVTHLPQVAAQGHQHLRVTKASEKGHTHTAVNTLSPLGRVEEIARMLGGVEITARARAHAREMLAQASAAETTLSSPPGT